MKQLTKNQLKILAMVCMTIDHIGAAFFPQAVWLRVIGRLAFPLFSYCIAEGCRYTRNKARYFGSVFACGAVCVIAFLPFGSFYGNALITLSMSILLLYGVEAWKSSGKLRFLALTAALAAVFYLLCRTVYIDYGFAGVQRFCVLAIFPILLLGKERGKWKMKHFFYIYYPAHLALIGAMRMALEAVAG